MRTEELIDLDAALARMLAALPAHRLSEELPLPQALGRVLAAGVSSPIDVPGADNSQMDGYALRAADVATPGTRLPVTQRIAAGHPGVPLAPGSAARIFTGASIPEGADAVVPQEQCEADGDTVIVREPPRLGDWIRRRGCDVAAGTTVLAAGHRLRPQDLGQIASVGVARVTVAHRPRVALLSTGDELSMPGEALRPGAIYNSNRFMLAGMLRAMGCEVDDLGQVPDRLDATTAALAAAAADHDLVLSSGGVSVGGEDHVRPAVQTLGELDLWQIAIKPGKPLAFGSLRRSGGPGRAHFVGVPGNPVAAFVTFAILVRPFLLAMQGATRLAAPSLNLAAASDWKRPDRRREFLRARIDADGRVALHPNQNSAVLSSAVWAEGLVDNPPGRAFAAGERVRFIPFSGLLY